MKTTLSTSPIPEGCEALELQEAMKGVEEGGTGNDIDMLDSDSLDLVEIAVCVGMCAVCDGDPKTFGCALGVELEKSWTVD